MKFKKILGVLVTVVTLLTGGMELKEQIKEIKDLKK